MDNVQLTPMDADADAVAPRPPVARRLNLDDVMDADVMIEDADLQIGQTNQNIKVNSVLPPRSFPSYNLLPCFSMDKLCINLNTVIPPYVNDLKSIASVVKIAPESYIVAQRGTELVTGEDGDNRSWKRLIGKQSWRQGQCQRSVVPASQRRR